MVRPLVNLVATILALVFFEHLGWVTVKGSGAAAPTDGAHIVDVLIVGALMFEIGEVLEVFFFSALVPLVGWVLALLPFYAFVTGYVRLEAASVLLPSDWLVYSKEVIPLGIMSFVFGATRWHLSRYKRRLYSMDDEMDVRELDEKEVTRKQVVRR